MKERMKERKKRRKKERQKGRKKEIKKTMHIWSINFPHLKTCRYLGRKSTTYSRMMKVVEGWSVISLLTDCNELSNGTSSLRPHTFREKDQEVWLTITDHVKIYLWALLPLKPESVVSHLCGTGRFKVLLFMIATTPNIYLVRPDMCPLYIYYSFVFPLYIYQWSFSSTWRSKTFPVKVNNKQVLLLFLLWN